MGSPAIAALIAHVAFWCLLAYGWFWDEVPVTGAVIFLALWAVGFFGLPYVPHGTALFRSYLAALDIVLVFIIFKGDLKLT